MAFSALQTDSGAPFKDRPDYNATHAGLSSLPARPQNNLKTTG